MRTFRRWSGANKAARGRWSSYRMTKATGYSKTVIVAPVSKQMSKPPIPTHVIFSAAQLSHVSMILCEQAADDRQEQAAAVDLQAG